MKHWNGQKQLWYYHPHIKFACTTKPDIFTTDFYTLNLEEAQYRYLCPNTKFCMDRNNGKHIKEET